MLDELWASHGLISGDQEANFSQTSLRACSQAKKDQCSRPWCDSHQVLLLLRKKNEIVSGIGARRGATLIIELVYKLVTFKHPTFLVCNIITF